MDIFKTLENEYTINGEVSMKAIEDDIETIQERISDIETRMRTNLTPPYPEAVVYKLNKDRYELSTLKKFHRMVKDRGKSDAINNVIETAAKSANETETPATAASGRDPLPQNFEASEFEQAPPPTIDDYYEPIVSQDGFYEMNEEEQVQEMRDPVANHFKLLENNEEWANDVLPDPSGSLYASFDLSQYTDQTNTERVKGHFIGGSEKVVELEFIDIRDYPIYVLLVKEMQYDNWVRRKFFKKPRSIFMHVTREFDGETNEYVFEFTDCRPIKLMDTNYETIKERGFWDSSEHNWRARLKYKDLKISNGTTRIKEQGAKEGDDKKTF